MRQLIIQVLLILGTLGIAWRLLLGYGQKAQALRRLGLLAFAAFAVFSVLFPNVWTRLANLVGIGRGADLILYGLVVAFFSFVVTTFKRFRDMETRYTRLARRVAIDETLPPTQHPAVIGPAPAPADQETLRDTPRESSRETLRETLREAPLETPVPQAPAALESELPRDAS